MRSLSARRMSSTMDQSRSVSVSNNTASPGNSSRSSRAAFINVVVCRGSAMFIVIHVLTRWCFSTKREECSIVSDSQGIERDGAKPAKSWKVLWSAVARHRFLSFFSFFVSDLNQTRRMFYRIRLSGHRARRRKTCEILESSLECGGSTPLSFFLFFLCFVIVAYDKGKERRKERKKERKKAVSSHRTPKSGA